MLPPSLTPAHPLYRAPLHCRSDAPPSSMMPTDKSSKAGKDAQLLVAGVSPEEQLFLPEDVEKALFFDSLSTNVPEGDRLLKAPTSTEGRQSALLNDSMGGLRVGGVQAVPPVVLRQPPTVGEPPRRVAVPPGRHAQLINFVLNEWTHKSGLASPVRCCSAERAVRAMTPPSLPDVYLRPSPPSPCAHLHLAPAPCTCASHLRHAPAPRTHASTHPRTLAPTHTKREIITTIRPHSMADWSPHHPARPSLLTSLGMPAPPHRPWCHVADWSPHPPARPGEPMVRPRPPGAQVEWHVPGHRPSSVQLCAVLLRRGLPSRGLPRIRPAAGPSGALRAGCRRAASASTGVLVCGSVS